MKMDPTPFLTFSDSTRPAASYVYTWLGPPPVAVFSRPSSKYVESVVNVTGFPMPFVMSDRTTCVIRP
jgi:hypothetical protein